MEFAVILESHDGGWRSIAQAQRNGEVVVEHPSETFKLDNEAGNRTLALIAGEMVVENLRMEWLAKAS